MQLHSDSSKTNTLLKSIQGYNSSEKNISTRTTVLMMFRQIYRYIFKESKPKVCMRHTWKKAHECSPGTKLMTSIQYMLQKSNQAPNIRMKGFTMIHIYIHVESFGMVYQSTAHTGNTCSHPHVFQWCELSMHPACDRLLHTSSIQIMQMLMVQHIWQCWKLLSTFWAWNTLGMLSNMLTHLGFHYCGIFTLGAQHFL